VTFDPPQAVLGPQHRRLLAPLGERALLSLAVADRCLRFDRDLAAMHYRDFVRDLLVQFGAKHLILGFNHHLEFQRQELRNALPRWARKWVQVTRACGRWTAKRFPAPVRHLLDEARSNRLATLGRLTVTRTVVPASVAGGPWDRRNLELPADKLFPAHGVYVIGFGWATGYSWRLERRRGADFRGGSVPGVEAHLLDFDGDLYGHRLQVHVLSRLRAECAFADSAQLVAQIHQDLDAARSLPAWNDWARQM
jgi:riboflavin kinase/FMN adenylyltransferase